MNTPDSFEPTPRVEDDHSLARMVLEYQFLRRQLIELHSADPNNTAGIAALLSKIDATRATLHAEQPRLGAMARMAARIGR